MCTADDTNGTKRVSSVSLLVCGFLNPLVLGGTIYSFGFYGNALKQDFHLTQSALDTISSVFFAAGLFAWLPGMIVDRYLSMRVGIIVGAFWTILNISLYWSILRQFVVLSHFWLIVALSAMRFIISLTVAMMEAGTYKSILVFAKPSFRGLAAGLAKGYPGMGNGVFSLIFATLGPAVNTTTLNYPIMMACFILIIIALPTILDSTLLGSTWHPTLANVRDETRPVHYYTLLTGYMALALVLTLVTMEYLLLDPIYARSIWVTVIFLIVWIGPITALICLPKSSNNTSQQAGMLTDSKSILTEKDAELAIATESDSLLKKIGSERDDDDDDDDDDVIQQFTLLQMLSTATAWYLMWTFVILIGQFMVVLNNMGELVQAQGFNTKTMTPVALALTSVAQALTRVGAGFVSGAKVPGINLVLHPPIGIILSCVMALIGHWILAIGQQNIGWFLVGTCLSSAGFGAAWPLMMLVIGDIFGMENFGSNYMFYDGASLSIGTVTLAKFLTQTFYQANIHNSNSTTCYGQGCFRGTFIVLVWLLLSAMASGVLVIYSPLSKKIYGRLFC